MPHQYTTVPDARVGILMGSTSDWPTMERTSTILTDFGVTHEVNVISAHRAPKRLEHYLEHAEDRGIRLIIAAAGGAAHLGGVCAALTHLPVLACPMKAWSLEGLDSLLSMVQMPKGVPVATFAIGGAGATNAALFAVQVLAGSDTVLRSRLLEFRAAQSAATHPLPTS